MEIRKIQQSDFNSVYDILRQVWHLDDLQQFKHNANKIINGGAHWFVAIQDSKVVGSSILYLQFKVIRNGCTSGVIEEVVIDENHRGNGVGNQLIKYIIADAFDTYNCYKVILSCFDDRVKFYERCGLKKESHTMRIDK